jgi:basic amino acid/polyamine antiporter, APA family
MTAQPTRLARRLGLGDAVVIGLGSMIGAGVFAAFAPAASAAGSGLLIGLAVAAAVAFANAISSARLAALYPDSGGTYVYATRRLGPGYGYAAGWSFVVGKTASCAAMALTVGAYVAPRADRLIAAAAVVLLAALNYRGIRKSAWLTRVIVGVTLLVLAAVVVALLQSGQVDAGNLTPFPGTSVHGVLQSAALLFFAFAGYARIATLGEEVREPARTIPRAIAIALTMVLVVYAVLAVVLLSGVGPAVLAGGTSPLRSAVEAVGAAALTPVVAVGAALAALGSLLALLLGVSRTTFAMARDGYLPRLLSVVHPRFAVPANADLAIAAVVVIVVLTVDVRGAIGFSSFGVLLYYALANASALTLSRSEHRPPRWLAALGLAGCLVLAANLPLASVIAGVIVVAVGALGYIVTRRWRERGANSRGE